MNCSKSNYTTFVEIFCRPNGLAKLKVAQYFVVIVTFAGF